MTDASNEVAQAVATAFASPAKPPTEIVKIEFSDIMDAVYIQEHMAGKTWDCVDFRSDMWLLGKTVWFSQEGFLYYLPGMIMAAIGSDDPDYLCLLVSRMAWLADQAAMSMSDYLKPLTETQHRAVAAFVKYIVDQGVCMTDHIEGTTQYWLEAIDRSHLGRQA